MNRSSSGGRQGAANRASLLENDASCALAFSAQSFPPLAETRSEELVNGSGVGLDHENGDLQSHPGGSGYTRSPVPNASVNGGTPEENQTLMADETELVRVHHESEYGYGRASDGVPHHDYEYDHGYALHVGYDHGHANDRVPLRGHGHGHGALQVGHVHGHANDRVPLHGHDCVRDHENENDHDDDRPWQTCRIN